jgi:hypothetical protein
MNGRKGVRSDDRKRSDPTESIHRSNKQQSKLVIANIHTPADLVGKVRLLTSLALRNIHTLVS